MKTKRILRKSLVESTDNLLIQLFRYTFVGGAAFVVDYFLLIALTELCGLDYRISASLSFLVGLLVNYFISKVWVFRTSKFRRKGIEFLFFALIGVVGLLLNTALIWIITEFVGIPYYISKIITAVLVYLYNFLARKYFIFTRA